MPAHPPLIHRLRFTTRPPNQSSFIKTAAFLALLVPTFFSPLLVQAADAPPRVRILITENWRFQKGDPEGAGDTFKYDKFKP